MTLVSGMAGAVGRGMMHPADCRSYSSWAHAMVALAERNEPTTAGNPVRDDILSDIAQDRTLDSTLRDRARAVLATRTP